MGFHCVIPMSFGASGWVETYKSAKSVVIESDVVYGITCGK